MSFRPWAIVCAMYTRFFGLNEKPFAITPDPRYLFMSARHGEGLAHLLYGVTDSGGFIQLTGEVGTGKTTLVRTLLGQLPDEVDVALILNPQVSVLEFLQAICRELDIALPERRESPMALVDALNRHLLEAHARGRRVILLVDEAQNLAAEVLEQLRLLTNLETAKQKLLQIILIGQPELRDILAQNNLRQLAQRVTGRYHLEPLSKEETSQYIDHRMKVAGGIGEIFDDSAKREVHRISKGIPRIINVICDRALLGAYSRETRVVDRALIRRAAREVAGGPQAAPGRPVWKWVAVVAAAVAFVAIGIAAVYLPGIGREAAVADPVDEPLTNDEVAVLAVSPAAESLADERLDSESSPPASATLDDALIAGDLQATADAAMQRLLAIWGVHYVPGAGTACDQAVAAGLSCLWQRGSWRMIELFDRPAVLSLTDSQGDAHEVLLTGLADGHAELFFNDEARAFPIDEISELWFGKYLMLWRPPSGNPRAIMPGSRGPAVLWLRRSLAELNGRDDDAAALQNDYFDASLEEEVRAFQRRHRLQVDGLAGEQTQIILNSALARDASPTLSGES
ncbi:MAG: AAA family ATPase [Woeseiaceae bacterium]|nr:AAA family ATPase [Woeseiaceae bacterium]